VKTVKAGGEVVAGRRSDSFGVQALPRRIRPVLFDLQNQSDEFRLPKGVEFLVPRNRSPFSLESFFTPMDYLFRPGKSE
jgi:hypothetical protein